MQESSNASDRNSISRASFTSDPNFSPSKTVRPPRRKRRPSPRSPKRKWLVNTTMQRHVHPIVVDAQLDQQTRQRKAEFTQALQSSTNTGHGWKRAQRRSKQHKKPAPPPEVDQETQKRYENLLQERHLHNRYLDLADKDGDGEIDTNWENSKDKRFSTCPAFSPKRQPFSAALFPGHETLFFVNNVRAFDEKPPLSLLTSPRWNGRTMNPAMFSAPPGLKEQAPLDGPPVLPIVPFLTSTKRREKISTDAIVHEKRRWRHGHTPPTNSMMPRSSYYQGLQAKAIRQDLYDRGHGRWRGPPEHVQGVFLARHHHGTYGDSTLHVTR